MSGLVEKMNIYVLTNDDGMQHNDVLTNHE